VSRSESPSVYWQVKTASGDSRRGFVKSRKVSLRKASPPIQPYAFALHSCPAAYLCGQVTAFTACLDSCRPQYLCKKITIELQYMQYNCDGLYHLILHNSSRNEAESNWPWMMSTPSLPRKQLQSLLHSFRFHTSQKLPLTHVSKRLSTGF